MSDRLSLLQTLLERERERRDAALLAWQQAQARAQAACEQARSLSSYRGEYHQRWHGRMAQAVPIELLRCYRSFGERLDDAIDIQDQTRTHHDAAVAQAHARLVQMERKLATVQRLIERRLQAQTQLEQRREQKRDDEAAQRMTRERTQTLSVHASASSVAAGTNVANSSLSKPS